MGEGMPDATHDTTALAVRVTGRVQGVSFRAWTLRRAEALGLSGWVRNEADGSVVAVIAGPRGAVERMVRALHEGPRAAAVREVATEPTRAPEVPGFRIAR
jgi:acylphosphatase